MKRKLLTIPVFVLLIAMYLLSRLLFAVPVNCTIRQGIENPYVDSKEVEYFQRIDIQLRERVFGTRCKTR